MDRIMKAINCSECQQVLETPIILPCQHSICQKHVNEKNIGDKIRCSKCGVEHEIPANGFLVVEALCEIIESQIGSIDFGSVHKEAVESCGQLGRYIQDIENLLSDPSEYIYEEISRLKNRLQVKSEEIKFKIDIETDKLLNKLNDYQNQCKTSLSNEFYLKEKANFEVGKNYFSVNLDMWKAYLNEVKVDEEKWREITEQSRNAIDELEESFKIFKGDLLGSEFYNYQDEVDFFEENFFEALLRPSKDNSTTTNEMRDKVENNTIGSCAAAKEDVWPNIFGTPKVSDLF